jgi:caa(3)-type oxidase subunit IV
VSQNIKLILLLILAIWKAMLVALFFMHLKFERWRLRLIFIVPLPLAIILVTTVIMEHVR